MSDGGQRSCVCSNGSRDGREEAGNVEREFKTVVRGLGSNITRGGFERNEGCISSQGEVERLNIDRMLQDTRSEVEIMLPLSDDRSGTSVPNRYDDVEDGLWDVNGFLSG